MTIDTTFTIMTASKIQPIKAIMSDTENSTRLGVRIASDNLLDICTLYWALFGEDGAVNLHGNIEITGDDYTAWAGDNSYPFTYSGQILGLTFI